MPIKKLSFFKKLLYGIMKVFFFILPLFIAFVAFSIGASIVFVTIGLVVYYYLFNRINRKNKIKNSSNSPENFSFTSENGLVFMMADRAQSSDAQGLFPVVLPIEGINIRSYSDPDESLDGYKTFDFDYNNKTNPLLEKELFGQLEKVLQKHKLTRDNNNPQIVISMDFFIGKKEQYTPPTTVTSTKLMYDWNFASFGGNWGGFSSTVPITSSSVIPGYTAISYYSNIRLNFLNSAKLGEVKPELPPLIWIGEADSEGFESDIRRIAPVMFGELMREFPDKSVNPSNRSVYRVYYGGLGIGFDLADWRIIRYVEPFSVAAEHGIKPGDVILKVNENRANIDWRANRQYLNNSRQYRLKDPYFKYVLSNRGDSDVELVIQSAQTNETVTLKMRPHSESDYVLVDNTRPLANIVKSNPVGAFFGIIIAIGIIYFFIRYIF